MSTIAVVLLLALAADRLVTRVHRAPRVHEPRLPRLLAPPSRNTPIRIGSDAPYILTIDVHRAALYGRPSRQKCVAWALTHPAWVCNETGQRSAIPCGCVGCRPHWPSDWRTDRRPE